MGPCAAATALTPADVRAEVRAANLRGRGGAYAPTVSLKGASLPDDGRPRHRVVNGDESEPGSFSGRMLPERCPHLVLGGALLAAHGCGARLVFIYLRGEFHEGFAATTRAVAQARSARFVGGPVAEGFPPSDVVVQRGAGGLRRGDGDHRITGGPEGRPAEPAAVRHGRRPLRDADGGHQRGDRGQRGADRRPRDEDLLRVGPRAPHGPLRVETGTPLAELILVHAGGPEDGHEVRFVLPTGAGSAPVLPGDLGVPLDFGSPLAAGSMLGSAGMVVCDDRDCAVAVAHLGLRFHHHESCGRRTPCREGTGWALRILGRAGAGRATRHASPSSATPSAAAGACVCWATSRSHTSPLSAFPEDFAAHERAACPRCRAGGEAPAPEWA